MAVTFPIKLSHLLSGSAYEPPLRSLAGCVSTLVAGSGVPFFPGYTDHGESHISDVLASAVDLVPADVWDASIGAEKPLLTAADAAVLIGATLLHDIAMHLNLAGFLALVQPDSRFRPLPWFDRAQEDHTADRPWPDLWGDYEREARRFDHGTMGQIVGDAEARGYVFDGLKELPSDWSANDRLVVGEFIRRNHARLAHEIAIYGFPGLPTTGSGGFAAMGCDDGHGLHDLADLIGLTARSHWLSMRVCKAYLDADTRYRNKPRPLGTAVLYPMALLRVADYLQIDRKRAPAVLLQLKQPPSPVSVDEWLKHQAVVELAEANDPRGYMVTVSDKVPLPQYLSLCDLVRDLQAEMDHATAVLDEFYGNHRHLGLDRLTLAKRRVHTNLHDPDFRASLPYVPEAIGYTMDPRLLSLLVEPLYGPNPGIGVRELMQNSVDAVRELHAWCERHGQRVEDLDLPDQEADVLIDFIEQADGSWLLRVTDKGIGMTAETIRDHFLRAGSSYRYSREWGEEFLGEDGTPRVVRSGRFGIGAFAIFLLGDSFTVRTRHVTAGPEEGWEFGATSGSQRVEIRRCRGSSVGATIEVPMRPAAGLTVELGELGSESVDVQHATDWYNLCWPLVSCRVENQSVAPPPGPRRLYPVGSGELPPQWSVIRPAGYGEVRWTFDWAAPLFSCNGFTVEDRSTRRPLDETEWWPAPQFRCPAVEVDDPQARLPLSLDRGRLEGVPAFAAELAHDVAKSITAHALVCGPTAAHASDAPPPHPLCSGRSSWIGERHARWCCTGSALVFTDALLLPLLGVGRLLVTVSDVPWRITWPAIELGLRGPTACVHAGAADRSPSDVSMHLAGEAMLNLFGYEWHPTAAVVAGWPDVGVGHLVTALSAGLRDMQPASSDGVRVYAGGVEPDWLEAAGHHARCAVSSAASGAYAVAACYDVSALPSDAPSVLADVWLETLGPRPIPFDPDARAALTEEMRANHPDLARHIAKWEALKAAGSKWTKP